jgi:uncharacterized membrane protein
MSDKGDYIERTVEAPTLVQREEVRVVRAPSNTGWWVAALVAVVAIAVGVFFYSNNQTSQADLQTAREQGAAQAQTDNALSNAQMSASQAAQSAQSAAMSTAQANDSAAQAAAARSAQAATNAARDAAATEPTSQPSPQ